MLHHKERPGPFQTSVPLILASASPRRQELLKAAGLDFTVDVSRVEEPLPRAGEDPGEYARGNARLKAGEVASRFPDHAIIGADTIVVLDGEILGKPISGEDAVKMLTRLCGARHLVITACCLIVPGAAKPFEYRSETGVWLSRQDRDVILAYVQGGEPMDKAGSYAVQGSSAFMVERLEGSYTNVVGLPMEKTVPILLEHGIIEVRRV